MPSAVVAKGRDAHRAASWLYASGHPDNSIDEQPDQGEGGQVASSGHAHGMFGRSMADTWAPVLRAPGNAERRLIMLWLADTDGSVRELEQVTGLSQSLVPYHLAELRQAGLVTPRAVGRTNRYALARPELQARSQPLGTLKAPASCGR